MLISLSSKLNLGLFLIVLLGLSACDSGSSDAGVVQAPQVPLVGPNLNGDTWVGFFQNKNGAFAPLTAVVTHIGNGVIIQTTLPNNGAGRNFEGNINSRGALFLFDKFDGEDWTTLFGPADSKQIKIADFVFINGVNTDTNSIELFR